MGIPHFCVGNTVPQIRRGKPAM